MGDELDTTPGATPAAAGSTTDPAAAGSTQDSTLESRYRGQTAKVNELTGKVSEAEKVRDAALAKLADYEAGKVNADVALKAQLDAEKAVSAALAEDAKLARIEAKYPESFAELGKAAAALTTEQLAALEARLGGADPVVVPTPRKHNESKTSPAGQPVKTEQTYEDAKAAFLRGPAPVWE